MLLRLVILVLALVLQCNAIDLSLSVVYAPRLFESFKQKFSKIYHSVAEENRRYKIFVENMKVAEVLNKANPHANFGVNIFSDMTPQEFRAKFHNAEKHFGAALKRGLRKPFHMVSNKDDAEKCKHIDWRKQGLVTPVKNQGMCGSCWAFSAIGNIEGQMVLAGHNLTLLSEQQLVSCDTVDYGCEGGLIDTAFDYLLNERDGEIVKSEIYEYVSGITSQNGFCADNLDTMPIGAVVSGYQILEQDEYQWASFVCKRGPLAIAVDASSFQNYISGVVTDCRSDELNHGVLIVGYNGADNVNPSHWIIKNSWSTEWGEAGYIRIARDTGACSIGEYAVSANVSSAPVPNPHPRPTKKPIAMFTQMTCQDQNCSTQCKFNEYALQKCYKMKIVGSAFASCTSDGVNLNIFPLSRACNGYSLPWKIPFNKCFMSWDGTYNEVMCNNTNF